MGSKQANFYNAAARRYGFADAAETVQDLYLTGRRAEAEAAVPDALIDAVTLCGPTKQVAERLAAYRNGGITTLIVNPQTPNQEGRFDMLRRLAEIAPAR